MSETIRDAKAGDALINAEHCFPDLQRLQSEFDILYFLDFCAGLDALVLHNNLFSIGALTSPDLNPIIPRLLESRVLRVYQPVISDPTAALDDLSNHPRWRQLMSLMPKSIPANDMDLFTTLMSFGVTFPADAVFEDLLQIPLVNSAHTLPMYLRLTDVQKEQKAMHRLQSALAEKYADFRDTLFALRQETDGEDIIRIPPIALEALAETENLERLDEVVMDIRDKYSKVRSQFAELEEVLRSGDETPKQKLKVKAKMSKSLNKLFSTDELDGITVATSFATRLNDMPNIGGIVKDGADLSDISYTKLIGFILEKAEAIYWKFRLRPLHATKQKYLNLSSNQIAGVIKRHFGHELTQRDFQKAERYWQEVQMLKINNEVA